MSNNQDLMEKLNRAVRSADRAIRGSAQGRPDLDAQAEAVNKFSEVVRQLDSRLLAIEEKLKGRD